MDKNDTVVSGLLSNFNGQIGRKNKGDSGSSQDSQSGKDAPRRVAAAIGSSSETASANASLTDQRTWSGGRSETQTRSSADQKGWAGDLSESFDKDEKAGTAADRRAQSTASASTGGETRSSAGQKTWSGDRSETQTRSSADQKSWTGERSESFDKDEKAGTAADRRTQSTASASLDVLSEKPTPVMKAGHMELGTSNMVPGIAQAVGATRVSEGLSGAGEAFRDSTNTGIKTQEKGLHDHIKAENGDTQSVLNKTAAGATDILSEKLTPVMKAGHMELGTSNMVPGIAQAVGATRVSEGLSGAGEAFRDSTNTGIKTQEKGLHDHIKAENGDTQSVLNKTAAGATDILSEKLTPVMKAGHMELGTSNMVPGIAQAVGATRVSEGLSGAGEAFRDSTNTGIKTQEKGLHDHIKAENGDTQSVLNKTAAGATDILSEKLTPVMKAGHMELGTSNMVPGIAQAVGATRVSEGLSGAGEAFRDSTNTGIKTQEKGLHDHIKAENGDTQSVLNKTAAGATDILSEKLTPVMKAGHMELGTSKEETLGSTAVNPLHDLQSSAGGAGMGTSQSDMYRTAGGAVLLENAAALSADHGTSTKQGTSVGVSHPATDSVSTTRGHSAENGSAVSGKQGASAKHGTSEGVSLTASQGKTSSLSDGITAGSSGKDGSSVKHGASENVSLTASQGKTRSLSEGLSAGSSAKDGSSPKHGLSESGSLTTSQGKTSSSASTGTQVKFSEPVTGSISGSVSETSKHGSSAGHAVSEGVSRAGTQVKFSEPVTGSISGSVSETSKHGSSAGHAVSEGVSRAGAQVKFSEPVTGSISGSVSETSKHGSSAGHAVSEGVSRAGTQVKFSEPVTGSISGSGSVSEASKHGSSAGHSVSTGAGESSGKTSGSPEVKSGHSEQHGTSGTKGAAGVTEAVQQHLETHGAAAGHSSTKEAASSIANSAMEKISDSKSKGADLSKESVDLGTKSKTGESHAVSLQTLDHIAQNGLPAGGLHALQSGLGAEAAGHSSLELMDKVGAGAVSSMGASGFPGDKVAATQELAASLGQAAGANVDLSKLESLQLMKEISEPGNANGVLFAQADKGAGVSLGIMGKDDFAKDPTAVGAAIPDIKDAIGNFDKMASLDSASKPQKSDDHAASAPQMVM